jgi:3-oxoacyl-[acyl-carrier-protein] synthase II
MTFPLCSFIILTMQKIVVTGIGLLTPLGQGVAANWQAIIHGTSGISRLQGFDEQLLAELPSQIAGQVHDFDASLVLDAKTQRKMDRFIQFGLVACHEALTQAGLGAEPNHPEKYGIMLGSGIGGLPATEAALETIQTKGPRRISPFFIPAMLPNMLAGQAGIMWGWQGPSGCPVSACATGADAIGQAFHTLRRGEAEVMLAGGAEACLTPLTLGGFAAAKALSTGYNNQPEQASRPFDEARDGFVIAEGAAVLVLETETHATARGATILAELAGYGQGTDGHHMTAPHPEARGARQAMRQALACAQLNGTDIDYVHAHATSTPLGDSIEAAAISSDIRPDVPVSSTKGHTGHMLGAAGSFGAAMGVLALQHQMVPPTINLQQPLATSLQLPTTAEDRPLSNVLCNAFGFGGVNASLVFKRFN